MGIAQEKQDILSPENREGKALEQCCQNSDKPQAKDINERTKFPFT